MKKSQLIKNQKLKSENSKSLVRMLEMSVKLQRAQGCAGLDSDGFPTYRYRNGDKIVRCAIGILVNNKFRYDDRTMFREISSFPLRSMLSNISRNFGYRPDSHTEVERLKDTLQWLQDSHDFAFVDRENWTHEFDLWSKSVKAEIIKLEVSYE